MAQSTVTGKFISATTNHYDFTAESEDGRPPRHMVGDKRTLWFDQGPDVAPADIGTKDAALYAEVAAGGQGTVWQLVCDLSAFGSKIVSSAVSARRMVPAANGLKTAA